MEAHEAASVWAHVTIWAECEDVLFLASFPTAYYAVGYKYGRFS